jgi:hypothetical protein
MVFAACNPGDEKQLLGKWQSERDWFLFQPDMIYNSGKDDIQLVRNFKYTIDPERKELNLYTDDKNTTYYLIYQFSHKDTLLVRNALSTNKTMIPFYRVTQNKP